MKKPEYDELFEQAWEIAQRTGEVAFIVGTPRYADKAIPWRDRHYGASIYQAIWPDGWRYGDKRKH